MVPRHVEQVLLGPEHHQLIMIKLHRGVADAGQRYLARVAAALGADHAGALGEAEIAGIRVGGQSLLEAMQLVGAPVILERFRSSMASRHDTGACLCQ
jgi:hypothetical protein